MLSTALLLKLNGLLHPNDVHIPSEFSADPLKAAALTEAVFSMEGEARLIFVRQQAPAEEAGYHQKASRLTRPVSASQADTYAHPHG